MQFAYSFHQNPMTAIQKNTEISNIVEKRANFIQTVMDLAHLLTKAGPHCLTLYFSKWCHCYKQLVRFLFEAELYQILIGSYSYFWENRCVDDTTINKIFSSLLCKTSRFHVALGLFNRRLQKASKCGNIISGTLGCPSYATFFVLINFDVVCCFSATM